MTVLDPTLIPLESKSPLRKVSYYQDDVYGVAKAKGYLVSNNGLYLLSYHNAETDNVTWSYFPKVKDINAITPQHIENAEHDILRIETKETKDGPALQVLFHETHLQLLDSDMKKEAGVQKIFYPIVRSLVRASTNILCKEQEPEDIFFDAPQTAKSDIVTRYRDIQRVVSDSAFGSRGIFKARCQ